MKPLNIVYAGTLSAFDQNIDYYAPKNLWSRIKDYFWTYKHDSVDETTRSAHSLINAIEYLYLNRKISLKDLQINMWGEIDKKYTEILKEKKLEAFFSIEGYKTKLETVKQLNQADILFLPLESGKNNYKPLFIPGKLFEYLKIGKPILLLAEKNSDCAKIVKKSNLGIICNPKNELEIAETLHRIISGKIDINSFSPNTNYIESFSFLQKTSELVKVLTE